MSNGKEGPLLVHVGRLGAEKNIKAIRGMMESIPNCCLAIVGTLQFPLASPDEHLVLRRLCWHWTDTVRSGCVPMHPAAGR
jgi:hypothetical protein